MGSGRGWSSLESVCACKAFVRASEDPLVGNGKKTELFVSQILANYNELMQKEKEKYPSLVVGVRTGDAIKQRFKKARAECVKFEGIIYAIKAKKPTGSPSESDIERAATAVFNREANVSNMYSYFKDASLHPGPMVAFEECLNYLRTTHTWSLLMLSRQNRPTESHAMESLTENERPVVTQGQRASNGTAEVDPANSNPNSVSPEPRPVGSKPAHELSKQVAALHRGSDAMEELARASKKRNKIAEDLLQVEKQQAMMSLYSIEGTDPSKRQAFLAKSQQRALKELYSGNDQETDEDSPISLGTGSPA